MESIGEIFEIFVTLAQAQSALCLLGASWIFTFAWVFATERNKGNQSRAGRALLGAFWLPGLLAYYLLPALEPENKPSVSRVLGNTPGTVVVPPGDPTGRGHRRRPGDGITTDGISGSGGRSTSRGARRDEETTDGSQLRPGSRTATVQAQAQTFQLRVLTGGMKGQVFLLHPHPQTYIGSHSNNHVHLRGDDGIARWHAIIERRGDEYILRDADGSRQHTTSVNSTMGQAKVRPLREGDTLRFGKTELKFERA